MSENLNEPIEPIETNEPENQENQEEEIPVIIQQETGAGESYSRYSNQSPYPRPPEESYNKLAAKEETGKNIYRWNIDDENNPKTKRKTKRAKKNIGLKLFAAIMSFMFLFTAAATAYGIYDYLGPGNIFGVRGGPSAPPLISNKEAVEETQAAAKDKDDKELEDTFVSTTPGAKILTTEEAIAKANPSVVYIEVEQEVQGYGRFFGRRNEPYINYGVGTGFIVSEDGYIATNYHVVGDVDKITVTLYGGEKYPAELIGGNEAEDLAIIKINAKNLTIAELGDSDALQQGQDVVAIGTPAGIQFAWTATKGIVSAVNREVDVDGQRTMTVIQTDASINKGNSGGPLINMRGQVVGINSMKIASTQYEGMGFAIPINLAIPIFNDIIENPGEVSRITSGSAEDLSEVSFGLRGETVDEETADYYNIPRGWQIDSIDENGASYNSGLQPGDIIIALDGEDVYSTEDMYELKLKYKPGDKVTVKIYRNARMFEFEVTLGSR